MGFVFQSRLIGPHRRRYLERHFALPEFVSRVIAARGSLRERRGGGRARRPGHQHGQVDSLHSEQDRRRDRCLARSPWTAPCATSTRRFSISSPSAAGFLVAAVTIGWQYALVWFGITSLRHVIVDLVARPRIPREGVEPAGDRFPQHRPLAVLDRVLGPAPRVREDRVRPPLAVRRHRALAYQFAKFFFISFVNGLYLVAHNRLRGFEKGVTGPTSSAPFSRGPSPASSPPSGTSSSFPASCSPSSGRTWWGASSRGRGSSSARSG